MLTKEEYLRELLATWDKNILAKNYNQAKVNLPRIISCYRKLKRPQSALFFCSNIDTSIRKYVVSVKMLTALVGAACDYDDLHLAEQYIGKAEKLHKSKEEQEYFNNARHRLEKLKTKEHNESIQPIHIKERTKTYEDSYFNNPAGHPNIDDYD